jgi:hypothetical protein
MLPDLWAPTKRVLSTSQRAIDSDRTAVYLQQPAIRSFSERFAAEEEEQWMDEVDETAQDFDLASNKPFFS